MKWLLGALLGLSLAAAQPLEPFLDAVQDHPALVASAALVSAARAQLDAVYEPLSLNASGNYTRLDLDLPEAPPGQDVPEVPENLVGLTLGASFRPFVFGDLSDLAQQRRIELERAELSYRETLASLETQALEAAANVQLAEVSLRLSETALELAEQVLAVTRTRLGRGAATESDLRDAQQRVLEAQNAQASAQANVEIARRSLKTLVGEVDAPALPELRRVTGTPPAVDQARLDLALAEVGISRAERALYPTAQASYTWPLNDEKSELSLSLESRTLQPSVTYSYANPKQGAAGFSAPEGVPASALKGSFTVGVSVEISPEAFAALEAAQARAAASAQGLKAALDNAELSALSVETAYQNALRTLSFARVGVDDAEAALADIQTRLELGLATDLDVAQARFALTQARVNLFSARSSLLQAVLEGYRSYAIPPSEVLP